MIATISLATILAQGIWDSLSVARMLRGVSSSPSLVVIGILALAIIAYCVKWKCFSKPGRAIDDPKGLFIELCRAHGICRSDQRRLEKLAEAGQLAGHAEIFLRPELFENAEILQKLGSPQELAAIRLKLFS